MVHSPTVVCGDEIPKRDSTPQARLGPDMVVQTWSHEQLRCWRFAYVEGSALLEDIPMDLARLDGGLDTLGPARVSVGLHPLHHFQQDVHGIHLTACDQDLGDSGLGLGDSQCAPAERGGDPRYGSPSILP